MKNIEWRSISTYFKNKTVIVGRFLIMVLLIYISLYFVWGWLTMVDIQKYCAENKLPFEETLQDLLPIPHQNLENVRFHFTPDAKLKNLFVSNYTYHVGSYLPIYRYVVPFHVTKNFENKDGKNTKESEYIGAWLLPFLMCTENTRNTLFCFGLGFLVSIFLVGIELLGGKPVNFRRFLLRPILGGLAAGLLFITVISGGALLWEQTENVRGLSVGIIAVFASLKCERVPKLLLLLTEKTVPNRQ